MLILELPSYTDSYVRGIQSSPHLCLCSVLLCVCVCVCTCVKMYKRRDFYTSLLTRLNFSLKFHFCLDLYIGRLYLLTYKLSVACFSDYTY